VRGGGTLSDDLVPTSQRSSAVATGRPRVLVVGGKLHPVRKAQEFFLDRVRVQFPEDDCDCGPLLGLGRDAQLGRRGQP
jgi:hypothetical protein